MGRAEPPGIPGKGVHREEVRGGVPRADLEVRSQGGVSTTPTLTLGQAPGLQAFSMEAYFGGKGLRIVSLVPTRTV